MLVPSPAGSTVRSRRWRNALKSAASSSLHPHGPPCPERDRGRGCRVEPIGPLWRSGGEDTDANEALAEVPRESSCWSGLSTHTSCKGPSGPARVLGAVVVGLPAASGSSGRVFGESRRHTAVWGWCRESAGASRWCPARVQVVGSVPVSQSVHAAALARGLAVYRSTVGKRPGHRFPDGRSVSSEVVPDETEQAGDTRTRSGLGRCGA